MEHITNKIDRESLKPGDHIYAYRKLHSYSHHGIFIGGDRVIHYNKTKEGNTSKRVEKCKNCGVDKNHFQGVVKSCVNCFLKDHTLRCFQYAVGYGRYLTNQPGTCTTGLPHTPEVTIKRANDLFNKEDGFGDYNLFENNSEAFAVFCKTEKRVSDQAFWAKSLIKASVKVAMDGLLRAVLAHHGEEMRVSDQAFWAKSLIKARVKVATDRLLHDVSVHHGEEKHNILKHRIDSWLAVMSSLKQIIANLEKDINS